jgi:hypothetical protein
MAYTSSQVVQAVPTGINSALVFISSTTLSTASVTFTNAFSTTYKNYLVLLNQVKAASGTPGLYLTLGSASSGYSYSQMYAITTSTFTFSQGSSVNAYMYLADMDSTNGISQVMNILSPFQTDRTTIVSEGSNYSGSPQWSKFAGLHTGATSFTSFTLATSTAVNLSGTVEVYGYTNS